MLQQLIHGLVSVAAGARAMDVFRWCFISHPFSGVSQVFIPDSQPNHVA
ncbi:MAG: hypothetical protein GY832_01490 [Chloroflexi bacterium]|nr:hypothetical protein [Chloroflexota bacterium]